MVPFTDHPSAGASRDVAVRRWEQRRATGRSAFIWRNGVVGWGLPAALLTAVYKLIQEQGLVWPPHALSPELRLALALIAIAFPALGYIFGAWLWDRGEAGYRAMLREQEDGDVRKHDIG